MNGFFGQFTDKVESFPERPAHYSMDKWAEYCKIISSFTTFDVPEDIQQLILEALHNKDTWDWFEDCNGANVVSEPGWKGKYHPAYVRHDYDWAKHGPTWKSNWTMHRIQLAYGMDRWRSWLRWAGVTFIGYPIYRLKRWRNTRR